MKYLASFILGVGFAIAICATVGFTQLRSVYLEMGHNDGYDMATHDMSIDGMMVYLLCDKEPPGCANEKLISDWAKENSKRLREEKKEERDQ